MQNLPHRCCSVVLVLSLSTILFKIYKRFYHFAQIYLNTIVHLFVVGALIFNVVIFVDRVVRKISVLI